MMSDPRIVGYLPPSGSSERTKILRLKVLQIFDRSLKTVCKSGDLGGQPGQERHLWGQRPLCTNWSGHSQGRWGISFMYLIACFLTLGGTRWWTLSWRRPRRGRWTLAGKRNSFSDWSPLSTSLSWRWSIRDSHFHIAFNQFNLMPQELFTPPITRMIALSGVWRKPFDKGRLLRQGRAPARLSSQRGRGQAANNHNLEYSGPSHPHISYIYRGLTSATLGSWIFMISGPNDPKQVLHLAAPELQV